MKMPRLSALVQVSRPINCSWLTIGTKKSGEKNNNVPLELRRRDAEDGERMLVHLNDAAHHAAIVLKMAVPIGITEHDVRGAVRAMLIGERGRSGRDTAEFRNASK